MKQARIKCILFINFFISLNLYASYYLAPISNKNNFSEYISRLMENPVFRRLSDINGFPWSRDIFQTNDPELAVQHHDLRTSVVAKKISRHYPVDSSKAEFLCLIHDLSAMPFRLMTIRGEYGSKLRESGYNSTQEIVRILKTTGFQIHEGLEKDILNFDINKTELLSDECKIAIASESVEGSVEDIFFGIKYGLISFEDIPGSITQLLGIDLTNTPLLAQRIKTDFNGLVTEIAYNALFSPGIDIDSLAEKAKQIKQKVRTEFLMHSIYPAAPTESMIKNAGIILTPAVQQLQQEHSDWLSVARQLAQMKESDVYSIYLSAVRNASSGTITDSKEFSSAA